MTLRQLPYATRIVILSGMGAQELLQALPRRYPALSIQSWSSPCRIGTRIVWSRLKTAARKWRPDYLVAAVPFRSRTRPQLRGLQGDVGGGSRSPAQRRHGPRRWMALESQRFSARFRADVFNLANRAQYGPPNANISASNFGVITTTAGN